MTRARRVCIDVVLRLWRGQLHAQLVYLGELQPWGQQKTDCEPLRWCRRGGEWRLRGDVVPTAVDGRTPL